ncbi:MAG: tRNA 2-thiocytidine biosynthesis protein TtcA [Bacilli bacterium]|nr:tRNA 2-thiocytidine biosynthesis protein TtcA [Bacilli bacterium]
MKEEFYKQIEHNIITKFRKPIWRPFTKAVRDFEMIKENDKIAVCMSGGKDSFLLAKCIQELKLHGRVRFDCIFLVMDPGYNKKNREMIENNAKLMNIPVTIFETNIFDSVKEIKDSPCYLCARMRRGNLYAKAKELGCNKIALGHHYDDVIETILMSMLYGGEIKTMMPKLKSTNFEGMELIRPMYYIKERDIISFKDYHKLTFLNCACRFTEMCEMNADMEEKSKRKEMKKLIETFRKKNEFIERNIFKSVFNVNLNTLIGYHKDDYIYNFLDDYDQEK